jgi:uncharacterized protein (TIGR02453 family)
MKSINPAVFDFLKHLNKNNNREWFEKHKPKFKGLESEIKQFSETLFHQINTHDSLEKWKVFRIYRDVRFSKNKTPYKTYFSIAFLRSKPNYRGSYYLHLSPSDSFLACGFWGPEPTDLLRIRKEFEVSADEFREIISQPKFKNTWGELTGTELKTAPKTFDKNHPDIDLIRKKQYVFVVPFSDEETAQSNFIERVNSAVKDVRPFVDFMSEVLTTDLNGEPII